MGQQRKDLCPIRQGFGSVLTTGLGNELGQKGFITILLAHDGRVEERRHFINISEIFCRTTNQTRKNLVGFPASYFVSFDDLTCEMQKQ